MRKKAGEGAGGKEVGGDRTGGVSEGGGQEMKGMVSNQERGLKRGKGRTNSSNERNVDR